MTRAITSLWLVLLLLLTAAAQFGPDGSGDDGGFTPIFGSTPEPTSTTDAVNVTIVSARTKVAPGSELRIAVILDHEDGWHTQPNIQAVEKPDNTLSYTTLTGSASDGRITLHPDFILWPEPEMASIAGGLSESPAFGGKAIVYLPAMVSPEADTGSVTLDLELVIQACDDRQCFLPATINKWLTIDIVPLSEAQSREDIDEAIFGSFPEDIWSDIRSGASYVNFDLFGLKFTLNAGSAIGMFALLLIAAAGGFLLNLTPCVLPVIPIKMMSLSHSAGSRGRTFLFGVIMSIGVIGFWLTLGGLIAFVKGFTATNQLFQYPAFTIGVGAFIAIMAIGMCGLFAIPLPKFVYAIDPKQETVPGAMIMGVLTAILSTPCTAPFMGAAVAWAAKQSPATIFATFGAIGFGMATPYLVLSAFPQLTAKVPRTGPASELIKQVMGLLMLAAAAYFVGVGISGVLVTPPDPPTRMYWWVVCLAAVAAGLWLFVRTIRITQKTMNRIIFGGIGLAIVAISAPIGLRLTDKGPIEWVYFTNDRFEAAKSDGQAVVMEFTAEWCLNCKALEQTVLHSSRVVELFENGDVVPMKVDITKEYADASAMLERVNRKTIPLLVIFRPDGSQAFIGDFYTVDQVIEAVNDARSSRLAER